MVSCSHKDILNTKVTYEIIVILIYWYTWQFVYSHDLINKNESLFPPHWWESSSGFVGDRGCFVEQVIQLKHED